MYSMSYLAKFYWLQGSRAVTIKDHQFCLLSTHSSPARTASWLGPRTCYQGRVPAMGGSGGPVPPLGAVAGGMPAASLPDLQSLCPQGW